MEYKKPLSIVLFTILATSSFTFLGAFPLFNVQQAEAQGLQLRVSAAERPQFENHFFGGQIVQIIIDDPGATDPDESTVGLVVNGFNSHKVHLSDGLWYTFFAEDQGFAVLADILSDNVRDNKIAISKAADDAGSPVLIGGANFAITTGIDDSFIAELEFDGGGTTGFLHVELNQVDLMPTLPPPFFETGTAAVINEELSIGPGLEVAGAGEPDETGAEQNNVCDNTDDTTLVVVVGSDAGLSRGAGVLAGDPDCDWPYVRLVGLEETSTLEIRAGSASVTLIFDDFADSIVAGLDRTTDYPLRAEVIPTFTDFMWNFNPVEEDSVYFVLDRATGDPTNILLQPAPLFDPAGDGQNFPDVFGAFTSDPGMEFDERQIQELDAEGVGVLGYINAFSPSNPAFGVTTFVVPPFNFIFENSRTVPQFDTSTVFNAAGAPVANPLDLQPVIGMFEGDPNVAVFDNTIESAGGRATLFTATNDRVASFDYDDIINSAPMTTHDGFTSVDREVYDSADRSIFTVTDPDQNLRSKISEQPNGRESNSFIKVGTPFPLVNTRNTGAGISNTGIDTVARMWAATFTQAGAVGFFPDATTFGIDGGPGSAIFADANNNGVIDIDTAAVLSAGQERYHAEATAVPATSDIVEITGVNLPVDNRNLALVFTPPTIGGDPATGFIVDTTLTLDNIDDVVTLTGTTGAQILGQVRLDNLFDGTADQFENYLVEVGEVKQTSPAPTGNGILGQDQPGGIVAGNTYDVRMPRYNLIHADLTDLQLKFNFGKAVIKIEAVDPACVADPDTVDVFATTCVHASQTVDFQVTEAAPGVDTDAVGTTLSGDNYNIAGGIPPAPTGGTNYDVWDALVSAAIDGTNEATGFDRDALTTRIGNGSFRVLDLERTADLNNDGLLNGNALTDRVRVTVLLLSPGGAASAPFDLNEPIETLLTQSQRAVVDIDGIGIIFNPAPTDTTPDNIDSAIGNTFSNVAYRLELDEEGSNSSIFTGRADFFTFAQFDTVQDVLDDTVLTGDPLRLWLPNRFIPPNRLAFSNLDEDIVQFIREVSATFIYETRDGSLEWDRSSFSFGQDAFLTITDEDLNRRPDATERYNLPVGGFVFFELGKVRVDDACALGVQDCFVNQIDATLLETGPNTGTFVSQITMPRAILVDKTPGTPADLISQVTQQQDLEANYIDIRDRSSVRQEFDDITNIRTTLGDVVLDRAAYPPGALMFVEIHDNDFNTDVDIRESVDLRQIIVTQTKTTATGFGAVVEGTQLGLPSPPIPTQGTALDPECDSATEFVTDVCGGNKPTLGVAPIFELSIFKTGVGRLGTLLPVGLFGITATAGVPAAATLNDRFGTGIGGSAILPILDRSGIPVTTALETGPNTGIFEFEVQLPGPGFDVDQFPITLPTILTVGSVEDPVIDANQPIQATYTDPADESGETEDEEELATFLFNTARLRTDKLEYGLGEPVDIIVEEPDFNRDSRSIDEVSFSILDIITDKFDTEDDPNANFACVVGQGPAAVLDACTVAQAKNLRMNLTNLRETGFNTGVFVAQLEEIEESLVDRGEDVQLIYLDKTPSGGGAEIRIQYEFLVVEILPEIIFDKEEYTPFDEFIVSIISPDSNQDPDRIETIRPLISSSTASLGRQSFPETGPNTGIFEENFDLTPDPTRFPGDLQAIREDGVTVEFRIDENTVATKSVFVNYHVGQVMFDKDAFRIDERGVLRVIDPDANRHPDTIDTTNVRFWSTTDRGGLSVVLRETGDRTGIFEEIITFTPDEESTGTRLRVSEGDTITAKFTDNTLPAPAALDAQETFTVEVEELFASALIGSKVPPLERAVASDIELVDQTGAALTDVTVGSQVLIQSEVTNSQTKKQPFAYIVQIKDDNDVTVSLSWVTGEIPAKDSLKAAQSWIPDAAGDYTIEVFVWASVDIPDPLSPTRTAHVTVS